MSEFNMKKKQKKGICYFVPMIIAVLSVTLYTADYMNKNLGGILWNQELKQLWMYMIVV